MRLHSISGFCLSASCGTKLSACSFIVHSFPGFFAPSWPSAATLTSRECTNKGMKGQRTKRANKLDASTSESAHSLVQEHRQQTRNPVLTLHLRQNDRSLQGHKRAKGHDFHVSRGKSKFVLWQTATQGIGRFSATRSNLVGAVDVECSLPQHQQSQCSVHTRKACYCTDADSVITHPVCSSFCSACKTCQSLVQQTSLQACQRRMLGIAPARLPAAAGLQGGTV